MKIKSIICLIALGVVCCSCGSFQQTTNANETKWLDVKCYQTMFNTDDYSACLAADDNNRSACLIVHYTCPISKKTEVYYDGKRLYGSYVLVGTFTYDSDGVAYRPTVQAFMPKDNFLEWYNYDKNALMHLLDAVLTYNSVK